MKNGPGLLAVVLCCVALSGCSFMTSFVVRNFSGEPVQVVLQAFTSALYKDGKPRIGIAKETTRLNSKGLRKFKVNMSLKDVGSGFYSFGIRLHSSVEISAPVDKYNLLSDEVSFYKSGNRILLLKGMADAVENFKYRPRGLFRSGGAIYHYDIMQ